MENGDLQGVGVIGLGEVGEVHSDAVKSSATSYLAAIADVDENRRNLYANQGIAAYATFDELLANDAVQTVSICLPHHLHFPVAAAAIAAGKNVLVEKPLTINISDAEELVRRADQAGVTLGVSHNQLYYTAHVEAKRKIEQGLIGDPTFLRMRLGIGPMWGGWRASIENTGGGLMIDAGMHRLYVALYLFGPVSACHAIFDVPRERGEGYAIITLRFESGAWGVIEVSKDGPEGFFEDEIEVVGTEAALRLSGLESHLDERDHLLEFRDKRWSRQSMAPDSWAETVRRSVGDFLDSVAKGAPAPVSGQDALATMQLLHQIYDSAVFFDEAEAR
jgi:predicted dehydrogenase